MQTPILTANPKANYLAHKGEIDAAVQRVLESGWYILGEEVAAFETEFAHWLGLEEAVGVANGTDALEIALRACGVGDGHLVLTTANTAVATVAAIERCGARPVFVDIDPASYTLNPTCLKAALQALQRSNLGLAKAVIPVHLYGHPADMPAILEIAERYSLYVVEDCAQAHGSTLHGKKVGTWGHLGAFSLYPTKNLGALGDGGIVVTGNPQLAGRLRLLRQYGWQERYISEIAGINSRLDPIQAAALRVKLRYLDGENARRQALARIYNERLQSSSWILPQVSQGAEHVYHQYTLRSPHRDELLGYLQSRGIAAQVLYPVPIHQQPAYAGRIAQVDSLEQTEKVMQEILSIPIYPELQDEQAGYVVEALLDWARSQAGG